VIDHEPGDERSMIRQVSEDESSIRFQFTAEHRAADPIEYELETMLTLDKRTLLVDVMTRTQRLLVALKHTRKAKKALDSVWSSLKSLNLGS
jgi:hypothetical protein